MRKLTANGLEPMTAQEIEFAKEQDKIAEKNAWLLGRLSEYTTVEECIHAILDGELEEIQAKRAEIKAKYPKQLTKESEQNG